MVKIFEIHRQQIVRLKHTADIYALDSELRVFEKEHIETILPEVINTAKEVGHSYCENFSLPGLTSVQQAFEYRYIHVPLLYKLGMTKEASRLAQATFEYLFPQLHKAVEARLMDLFGEDYRNVCNELVKEYICDNNQFLSLSYRIKSSHSIWKKIPSLREFQEMNREQFALRVNDFVGIRWEMKVPQNGNRYDALINGVRLAPLKHIKAFRNQQMPQENGFDSEPVMKLCYTINGTPLELQLFGGNISAYLCAKGYTAYKTKLSFSPTKNELSEDDWKRRLEMAIQLEEGKDYATFRKYMLEELIGNLPNYSEFKPFLLDSVPLLEENKTLRLFNSLKPIYELSNLIFQ